jgi:hypothetical protein
MLLHAEQSHESTLGDYLQTFDALSDSVPRNFNYFPSDILWRENKIDAAAFDGTFWHVGLGCRVKFLSDRNAAYIFDAT